LALTATEFVEKGGSEGNAKEVASNVEVDDEPFT
jgi:hypothetical protein